VRPELLKQNVVSSQWLGQFLGPVQEGRILLGLSRSRPASHLASTQNRRSYLGWKAASEPGARRSSQAIPRRMGQATRHTDRELNNESALPPPKADILGSSSIPLGANFGSERIHSITSSARATSEGGISMPNVFAVLRLMKSSNLVGCSTGKSAGFAPLSILST
jgi:hypothetical protein